MVSRDKLKSELHSFNENLDKHMKSIDFDNFSENVGSGSYRGFEANENIILLAENLKEVRYELNMMRKNLSSDVSTMVAKEITSLKNEFFDELLSAQTQVYEYVKSIDLTPVKEMADEVEDIKKKQIELDKSISQLSNDFSKKLISMNGHEEDRLSKVIEQMKLSHSALLKKFHDLGSSLHTIDREVKGVSQEVSGQKDNLKLSLQDMDKKYHDLSKQTSKLSQAQLQHFKKAATEDRVKVEHSVPKQKEEEVQVVSEPRYDDRPAQRIISIDEKLQRLKELR